MKKLIIVFITLFITFNSNSFAQTSDFHAGKWEIAVSGTPRGDVTFSTELVRKDGKLTGQLVNGDDKRDITKIQESENKLMIFFMSSQGGEISIDLDKVDNNTLKGSLMGYTANAMRIGEAKEEEAKTQDFFAGKWEIQVIGTPNGDSKLGTTLTRKDGKLTGELKDLTGQTTEAIPLTNVEDTAEKIILYFTAQGYDINVELNKVDDNNLKGMLMNMFETKAVRVIDK